MNYGNKGVITSTVADSDLPTGPDIGYEILMSPQSVRDRVHPLVFREYARRKLGMPTYWFENGARGLVVSCLCTKERKIILDTETCRMTLLEYMRDDIEFILRRSPSERKLPISRIRYESLK